VLPADTGLDVARLGAGTLALRVVNILCAIREVVEWRRLVAQIRSGTSRTSRCSYTPPRCRGSATDTGCQHRRNQDDKMRVPLAVTWVKSASRPGSAYWLDHIGDFGPP
jgi:hypothetical protein